MRTVRWTTQAQADLAAIRAFISQDSPHYAGVIVSRLIAATDRLVPFPESGRVVPEFGNSSIREVIQPPYRVVYRLVGRDEVHILTVHHSSRRFPQAL
ncbi:MAG TPA: type II toxin-antitoxin system RelE/ParE family toxin [Blastocatellia bacterium]|nr:type II toxin-antitoxin system RelE/ParE family toxin [Blastocatellia bacterium]